MILMLKRTYFYSITMKTLITLLFCSAISLGAVAQHLQYDELVNATATHNGAPISSPYCGGINSTQPNKADLNNDGKQDLVLYDNNTRTLKTFINTGIAGKSDYTYAPNYAKNFPQIIDYLILLDYNCDGISDLVHRGFSGFSVFKGFFNSQNELAFTHYKDLYYPAFNGQINAYVQPNDIPMIVDVDNDGDLDFVGFDVIGFRATWYKNLQQEENLPCDTIKIMLADNCYGKMTQTYDRTHQLNAVCKGNSGSNKKTRHSGNTLLGIDLNNDGLKDMMLGGISFNDLQVLYRGGSATSPLFTSQDTVFEADNHELKLENWPSPFYFDINNDGAKDLVATPHNDNIGTANYNAMAVYINEGTTASPIFKWTNDSALIESMIDVGRNSHPTLFDYDKDGKLDLFLGGQGYFNTNTFSLESKLAYYRNTSTLNNVSFELITKDFLNLSAQNYSGIYPTFGDVTGDGVDDLVLGNDSGTIIVFNNTATTNTSAPNFTFLTNQLAGIDVGSSSFPLVHDFNGDSKTDLMIGSQVGIFWIYHDSSATSTKDLRRVDSASGGVKSGSIYSYFSYGVPYIGVVDSTSTEYLLVGTQDGTIERYSGFNTGAANWTRLDSNLSNIQTAFRSAPAVGDLDGDQRPDMIIGSQTGGIQIFQFQGNVSSNVGLIEKATGNLAVELYPNPATNQLFIKTVADITFIDSYVIRDLSGRTVQASTESSILTNGISVENLNDGFYFIDISFGKNMHAIGKFLKTN